ncbi:MAG: alpha/beta hydrolase [Gammaproteobacteria bacterium]
MRALLAGLILLLPPAAAPARTLGGIEFTPCEIRVERVPGRVKAECARFDVPENRAAPEVRRIGVRLALVPSRSDRPLPDPIVFLAGGPGQSAIEAYPIARGALDPLLDRRHVLLVEQRGTGESNPLRCPLPDWKTAMDLSLEAAREDARKCLARYEGKADTRFYATSDYIADLEQVRRALGIPALNLAGGSYGTRVALEYLRRHPDAIRSVFIDSIAPPELALGQDHARNLDEAIASMARRCAQDAACRERFGDIDAALRALRQQVRAHARPVTFRHPQTNAAVTVKFGEAALGVARIFSYSPRTAALIPLLLSEAAAGRPEPLLAQAERLFDSLGDELASGMELSVICAEDADLLREDPADGDRLMGDEIPAYFRARCEVWPHNTRPADFKQPVVSAKPVLLLSGEHDPVTPPRYGEQVLKTLSNARHLVAKGQGHTPMNVGCLPRLYQQFVDKLDPRGLDASCLEALGDTPFFLDFQGPSP